jgi:DedD protein
MHLAFDEEELEPVPPRKDAELTLGPALLLGLFSGLAVLCGLFFAMGYAMGHRGSQATPAVVAQPNAETQQSLQTTNSRPKPSATAPKGSVAQMAVVNLPASNEGSEADGQSSASGEGSGNQPVVHPALSSQPPAQSHSSLKVLPASALNGAFLVQIAAVSHEEDAEVLVGALRRHGYAVTVSHDPADRLLHVRIGPFANRNEASTMREKLLSDGYNAMVQP